MKAKTSRWMRWAGRHMGIANYSETYTFRCLVEIDPAVHKMVDIPGIGRLVIQEIRNEHDASGLLINQTVVGKTFGSTLDAVVEPPVTIAPEDPPVIPVTVPPPTPIVAGFVMTARHFGRSLNFFDAVPTEWQDVGPRVGNEATIGYYRCMAVDKLTGEAWALTKEDVGTTATNGLFYTASIGAASPVWTLIYSQADYIADAEVISPVAGRLNTLALAEDGTVYAQADYGSNDYASYVWGNSGGCAFVSALGYPHDYHNTGSQFGAWAGATSARLNLGRVTNPGTRIIEATGAAHSSVYMSYTMDQLSTLHQNHFVNKSSELCSFVDSGAEGCASAVVYTDRWNMRPIVITDGHIFTTRASDGALMIDAVVQALVNTAGGVTGVFSAPPLTANGGGYCNPITYGHIAWVAASAHASNSIRDISYTEDGGVTWVTKDGDWATAMGEAYEGGAGVVIPMVGYADMPE